MRVKVRAADVPALAFLDALIGELARRVLSELYEELDRLVLDALRGSPSRERERPRSQKLGT